jgi:hypothetical protein
LSSAGALSTFPIDPAVAYSRSFLPLSQITPTSESTLPSWVFPTYFWISLSFITLIVVALIIGCTLSDLPDAEQIQRYQAFWKLHHPEDGQAATATATATEDGTEGVPMITLTAAAEEGGLQTVVEGTEEETDEDDVEKALLPKYEDIKA